jgi:DNA repair exonuclease SbcCD ATPase subunit
MKSKLEEKKNELAEAYWEDYRRYLDSDGINAVECFQAGFDVGIQAYKEMLEGVGVDGAKKIWSDDLVGGNVVGNSYATPKFFSEHKDSSKIDQYIELLPVLAKLQQQAEKIESLEKDLKHEQNLVSGYIDCANNFKSKITELEAKLPKVSWTNEMVKAQGERITELEKQLADMNRDCISLFLHEQRMKQLENSKSIVTPEKLKAANLRIEQLEQKVKELELKLEYHNKILDHNIDLNTKINGLEADRDKFFDLYQEAKQKLTTI